jgi:hypothetical protein
MMYAYVVKLMIRRALRHHQAGNVEALLKSYADDVRFVFLARILGLASSRGRRQLRPGCGDFTALA